VFAGGGGLDLTTEGCCWWSSAGRGCGAGPSVARGGLARWWLLWEALCGAVSCGAVPSTLAALTPSHHPSPSANPLPVVVLLHRIASAPPHGSARVDTIDDITHLSPSAAPLLDCLSNLHPAFPLAPIFELDFGEGVIFWGPRTSQGLLLSSLCGRSSFLIGILTLSSGGSTSFLLKGLCNGQWPKLTDY